MRRAAVTCEHRDRSLLSPWELVRKYACSDCSAVMTCACDNEIATYVVPHQALRGHDQNTEDEVAVTHPLVPQVCYECRSETAPAYPKAAHRGSASLVHRYYWHEIWRETELEFLAWCRSEQLPLFDANGKHLFFEYQRDHREEYHDIQRAVVDRIRAAHEQSPKYDFTRPSDADVIRAYGVTVENIQARYLTHSTGPVLVLPLGENDPSRAVQVEEFVARSLRAQGREVMFCESRPFQAIYGSLMWLWVQSPDDLRLTVSGFGGRDGVGADDRGLIWTQLPHDFGSPAHARRRREALEAHFAMLPDDRSEMLWTYDYLQEASRALRQYLWAYTEEDQDRGQTLVRVLGAHRVKMILRYLAGAYWERYCGWPDLVSWQETPEGPQDVQFIEVKSSSDKLSDDQRVWIKGNHDHLKLSFRIAKVHRTEKLKLSETAP